EKRSLVFPVQSRRRDARIRQPVKRNVFQNVVSRQPLRHTIKHARDHFVTKRVVIDYPCSQTNRRVSESEECLRAISHLKRVSHTLLKEKVEALKRMFLLRRKVGR